jgi:hypothetical protein
MIMWADSVEKHPALLEALPRDIVLAHWRYREIRPDALARSLAAGFEVVGVPAMSGEALLPNRANLDNVSNMGTTVRALGNARALGMVTCWWESMRVLRDATPFALAWAGRQLDEAPPALEAFAESFGRDFFGLADLAAARAILDAHRAAPERREIRALFPDSFFDLHQALNLATAPDFAARAAGAQAAADALEAARPQVSKNTMEFDALLLAARVVAAAFRNGQDLVEAWNAYGTAGKLVDGKRPDKDVRWWRGEATKALERALERTRDCAEAVSSEWDRTRYAEDEKKDNRSPLLRQRAERACLPILLQCPPFLERLIGS